MTSSTMPSSMASFSTRPASAKSRTMRLIVVFSIDTCKVGGMNETLPALGRLGRRFLRQAVDDRRGDLDGIFHLGERKTRMDSNAGNSDVDAVGREGLGLDRAGGTAVHRISEFGAELLQIDFVDTASDLLVRGEQHPDRAVADAGIFHQDLRRGHDLGDAGLVVGAKQRRPVGGDDVIADLVGKRRVVAHADYLVRIALQPDIAALIVGGHLRLHALASEVGRGVHVRAKADHRHLLFAVGRNGRVDIAVLVHMRVTKPDRQQFVDKDAAEILLLVRGWLRSGFRVGLGVDGDVAQKAVDYGGGHGPVPSWCESGGRTGIARIGSGVNVFWNRGMPAWQERLVAGAATPVAPAERSR